MRMHEPLGGIMQDRGMTLQDVADYLQLSRDQSFRFERTGRMPASRVGN